jgi:phage baseplate assembly protein V
MKTYLENSFRRIQTLFRVGTLTTKVDRTNAIPTMQVQYNEYETHNDIKFIQHSGIHSNPAVGSKLVVANLSGDGNSTVCIGTINHGTIGASLESENALVLTDYNGNTFSLSGDGKSINVTAGADGMNLKCDMNIEGNLNITGNLSLSGTLTTGGDATIAGKSFLQHKHLVNGITSTPTI